MVLMRVFVVFIQGKEMITSGDDHMTLAFFSYLNHHSIIHSQAVRILSPAEKPFLHFY